MGEIIKALKGFDKMDIRIVEPKAVITVSQEKYELLLAREERLRVLERAIYELGDYESVKTLKTIFGLKKDNGNGNV